MLSFALKLITLDILNVYLCFKTTNIVNKLILIALTCFFSLKAQQAPSYYSSIDFTKSGSDLKKELTELIKNSHTHYATYNELWDILAKTDEYNQNSQKITLIYGWNDNNGNYVDDYTRDKNQTCGNGNPCNAGTWNREHVFPKSLDQSGSNNAGPTADPHMLRPADVKMNSIRGNRKFAEGTGSASYTIGSDKFFPGDEWKGDVARIIMYMYVRYGNKWNPNLTASGSNSFHSDMPDIFLKWNVEDPVSYTEIQRNTIVQQIQGNRNPFIDNPYLATVIWGGPKANNTWPDTLSTIEYKENTITIYPNPTKEIIYINNINGDYTVKLIDSKGKLLFKNENVKQLKMPESIGIYYLQLTTNHFSKTIKIINK